MLFLMSCIHQKVPDPLTETLFEIEASFSEEASGQLHSYALTVLLDPTEEKRDGSFIVSAQLTCHSAEEEGDKGAVLFPQFRIFEDAELLAVVQKVNFSLLDCPEPIFDILPALLFPNPPELRPREERVSTIRWSGFSTAEDDTHSMRALWRIDQLQKETVSISYEGQWTSKGASGFYEAPYEGVLVVKRYGGLPSTHKVKTERKICAEQNEEILCLNQTVELFLNKVN